MKTGIFSLNLMFLGTDISSWNKEIVNCREKREMLHRCYRDEFHDQPRFPLSREFLGGFEGTNDPVKA